MRCLRNTLYLVLSAMTSISLSQEIADWAGFRRGAVSFTFDDGAPSHVTDGAPLFDKYGYKATFNLVNNWNPNWEGFQKMADNGHEIASHSNSHGDNMSGEEASSKANIAGRISQKFGLLTVAYPNCNVPDQDAVLQNYIAGRICNGSWQGIPDIMGKDGPSDWTKVPALMTGSESSVKSSGDFIGQMQKAVNSGGWLVFLTHGLAGKDNGYATFSPTDLDAVEGALEWVQQHDDEIWVAPFRNVAMYVKERSAAKIDAIEKSSSRFEFKLTHNIADDISNYDYPLSIRVENSMNWTEVFGNQDGKAIDAFIKDGFIYLDVVPNGGNVILSSENSSAEEKPSSSASTDFIHGLYQNQKLFLDSKMNRYQVFDMNGQLLKSANATVGSVRDVWNRASEGLPAGTYIMRYGTDKSMQMIPVRK